MIITHQRAPSSNKEWIIVSGVGLAIQPDIPHHRAEAQGGLRVPVSGVDEAEGCDREQVGDEAIRGKRLTRTPKRDMMKR